MPHHKSAKKRVRSDEAKRQRNKAYISGVRTNLKRLQQALSTEKADKGALAELFKTAQSSLGKAAQKGLIHKKNADRRVARLAKQVAATQK